MMTEHPKAHQNEEEILVAIVANIGGYNYIQSDLNNLMFAFTLHSIHKNTGIDFHTFASFEAGIQGAILSAVANMENNKVGIVQYREEVEAATMSSTNETYTDAHFNGRAYTKEQSEVIGDIYVNENILKLTGVTLDSFLFMNAICFSSLSGVHRSSLSQKAMYLPLARSMLLFRAYPAP